MMITLWSDGAGGHVLILHEANNKPVEIFGRDVLDVGSVLEVLRKPLQHRTIFSQRVRFFQGLHLIEIVGNSDVQGRILGLFAGFVKTREAEVPSFQFMPSSLL